MILFCDSINCDLVTLKGGGAQTSKRLSKGTEREQSY